MNVSNTFEQARIELARLHVSSIDGIHATFSEVARIVGTALGIDRFGIWMIAEDGQAIRCHHLFQRSTSDVFEGAILHRQDFPSYFAAVAAVRALPIHDALNDPITRELKTSYLAPLGITSLLDAPIFRGGKITGVVCHEHTGPARQWTQAECDFAMSTSDIIARLLEEDDRVHAETSLSAYQEHLRELHRMEALGRLAAGIAHDFRNVLTVAALHCDYIRETSGLPANVLDSVNDISEAIRRGDQMTSELLSFGKETPDEPRVLEVTKTIESFSSLLQRAIGKSINMEIAATSPTSLVFIDPSQLERAILNLVVNARDAMPNGGTIRIAVEDAVVTENENANGTFVRVSVEDTGIGMDESTRQRIFEPFFTTKGDKGTGLGLAIVYQVITRVGGFIRVESQPAKGTLIRFYLPRIGGKRTVDQTQVLA